MNPRSAGRAAFLLPTVLCLLLIPACATTSHGEQVPPSSEPGATRISVSELPRGRVRLSFPDVPADPALRRFSAEDAQAVLAAFHEAFAQLDPRLLQQAAQEVCSGKSMPALWDASSREDSSPGRALRDQFLDRYGPSQVPLPSCLEDSALVMALRLSPPSKAARRSRAAGPSWWMRSGGSRMRFVPPELSSTS